MEHSQDFKNQTWEINRHSYIWYSGLIAVSTLCLILLCADAHSTDTRLEHSTAQIHFSTMQRTMHFSSYSLPSLCHSHSLSATCNTLTRHGMTLLFLLNAGLICHLHVLNVWLCLSQSSGSVWHSVFFCRRHWHTGSLDVRGFAGCNTARCYCPLLQYFKLLYFCLYISRCSDCLWCFFR